ncbi:DUF1016 N-terminal domain-containing protein [Rudanella lutea]|uniref:DUF1016 N-terminal domain-containing protein n=1 Tax=Rudanella lutea TaxID=451374 RepID=UPI00037DB844|nr:DUF1016 N-terminal domain-containing protein [Rudanella lutea]
METPQLLPNPDSLVELHQFLRQLVSVDEITLRGEPDFARVEAYWHIGRIIVETEQQGQDRADYGTQLIEQLSNELTQHYGKGYRTSNLWWFRQFYLSFPILHAMRGESKEIRDYLRTELTWTHYRILISIENEQERHFYLHNAADEKWSYRTLNRLIKSRYYYQVALGEDKLLARTPTLSKTVSTKATHRSRVAQIRRTLLDQPGWALVERTASCLPMTVNKPDVLFYHYNLGRFIGLWVADQNPSMTDSISRQLTEWRLHRESDPMNYPLGLLVNSKNAVKLILDVATPPLSNPERNQLPTQL